MSVYTSYSSGEPTHQYYTLALTNPPKSNSTDQFPISYSETRNSPYLKDPGSYYASVVRFSCTTPLLPIFIPAIKDEVTQETEYTITMHHPGLMLGAPQRQSIFFQSLNPYIERKPSSSSPEFYYVYQPNEWIAQVNQTLASVWAQLTNAAYPATGGNAPFIQWNDDTSVGKFYVPYTFCKTPRPGATFPVGYPAAPVTPCTAASYTTTTPSRLSVTLSVPDAAKYLIGDFVTTTGFAPAILNTGPVKILSINGTILVLDIAAAGPITVFGSIQAFTPIAIYFNASLYNLFSSFTAENQASAAAPSPADGTHWKFIFAPTYENVGDTTAILPSVPRYNTFLINAGEQYTYITQQYSTVPLWNPVASFVFTTSILPINPESLSTPFTAGQTLTNGGNNAAIGTVLTDFEIPLETGWETKPTITYAPTAEYRLVDLNGNASLSNIQISIGWRNKNGIFIPLNIGPNGSAAIKLLFRKKDFSGL